VPVPLDELALKRIVDQIYLLWFTVGVTLMAVKLWVRTQEYRKANWKIPLLLWRDIFLFTGLALPFLAIFIARAADVSVLRDQLLWSIATGTPAVLGISFAVYVEFFRLRGTGAVDIAQQQEAIDHERDTLASP